MNTNYCFCGSFVVSLALVLAWGAEPACADAEVSSLPGLSASKISEVDTLPQPIEVKAQERHERPSMARYNKLDGRAVENVLPQLAVPSNADKRESGSSDLFGKSRQPGGYGATSPSSLGAMVPNSQGTTAPSNLGVTVPSGLSATTPSGRGATAPSGRGATAPSGRGATAPSGRGATAPSGLGSTVISGLGATAPSALGTTAPSGFGATTSSGLGAMAPNTFGNSTTGLSETPRKNTVKIYGRTAAAPTLTTTSPVVPVFEPQNVQLGDMVTAWGYGPRENKYNAAILKAAQKCWPHERVPLHPLLFKSLVANESAFNPSAVSYTGATGLTQLTPATMRRFGLTWSSSRDPQKAVPAGVKVLAEKAKVILEPQNYCKITGLSPARCPYAKLVADAYSKYGEPNTEQSYYLMLGAYNAGGGTILRAMAKAYKQGLDPREWSNLVGDPNNKLEAPLFKACQEIFPNSASAKYREISAYPDKIMKLYYRSQPRLI